MQEIIKELVAQLVALTTFFAFPAIQYVLLKRINKTGGIPELWYLPKYGFRAVIRNIPQKRTLTDIKYLVRVRRFVPASDGVSVGTYSDEMLVEREELFTFPNTDEIMICFRLQNGSDSTGQFVVTDKLGVRQRAFALSEFDWLICDYVANVKNLFNFDVKISKRVELTTKTMATILEAIKLKPNEERKFEFDRIREVG